MRDGGGMLELVGYFNFICLIIPLCAFDKDTIRSAKQCG